MLERDSGIGQLSVVHAKLRILGEPEDNAGGEEQFGPAASGGENFSVSHLRKARGLEDHPFAVQESRSLQVVINPARALTTF